MKILILAPHADDEVLGVGGTIARAIQDGHQVTVAVLTGHGEQSHPIWPPETWDVIRRECRSACAILGVTDLMFRDLPAACLDHFPTWKINSIVAELINEVAPDEIYVPFAHDLHHDHQAITYAAVVATRPYLPAGKRVRRVLAYETLSETHLAPPYLYPAFQPNVFVDISLHLERKVAAMIAYKSQLQADPLPRSVETLRALARVRGSHMGVNAAEAFVLLRETNR